jgi:hypothetical protein
VSKVRLLKVATPFTAAALVVLPVANPAGPVATATITVELSPVITFPKASSTAILSALSACPAVPPVGDCWTTSLLATAGLIVIEPVVAPGKPPSLTESV